MSLEANVYSAAAFWMPFRIAWRKARAGLRGDGTSGSRLAFATAFRALIRP